VQACSSRFRSPFGATGGASQPHWHWISRGLRAPFDHLDCSYCDAAASSHVSVQPGAATTCYGRGRFPCTAMSQSLAALTEQEHVKIVRLQRIQLDSHSHSWPRPGLDEKKRI
jgi:hypothetical protein